MLEISKALGTIWISKNLTDVTMNNQQETDIIFLWVFASGKNYDDPQRLEVKQPDL